MAAEILTGKHAVLEVLRAKKRKCYEIVIAEGKGEKIVEEIEAEAKKNKVPLKRENIHEGIAARCDPFPFSTLSEAVGAAKSSGNKGLLVVLDGIMDTQNLGALIRTSHLCGAHGIIIPKDNSAPISPATVRASSGATEYIPIVEVTNITSSLKDLKKEGFWVAGAAGEGAQNLYLFDFTGNNYVLVLGSEGKGIRRLVRENCDHLIYIPMMGKIESYNVSVAGAIFMSEIMRQRNFKTP